ncbi:MAG: LPS export ABC transporter permease LptG [Desulfarculales bacterium]|jgi:lipopolysaccharide export system permease protein|nr:LPS export ABC transporter permease LptG [Desulfarculales bacterium]
MNILARYLVKEFCKLFFIFLIAIIVVYMVIDSVENANRFSEAGLTAATMLTYLFLQIPKIISLVTPVAILLAVIITLGVMNNRNELTALKSAGVSLLRFSLPLLFGGLLLSVAMILLNELILPQAEAQANYIYDVLMRKNPPNTYYQHKFWHKGANSIYEIGSYDEVNKALLNVTYYHFDSGFNLDMRIDAASAQFMGDRWRFLRGLIQQRQDDGIYNAGAFAQKDIVLPEQPGDFTKLAKLTSEMTLSELAAFISKIERDGYDATRYEVDLHTKISMSLSCVITVLFAVPLALLRGQNKESNIARAVAAGMTMAFIYWVGSGFINSSLGYSGILPSVFSAWLINILYIFAAGWLYTHTSQ